MRMRSLLLPVGLLAALLAPARPCARAETLDDLAREQEALSRRVAGWIAAALRDAREDDFETYRKYQPADFAKGKNKIKATKLTDILGDGNPATLELRNRVYRFLKDAALTSADPDLSQDKRGGTTARKLFARQNLLPLLMKEDKPDGSGGDRTMRFHANDILKTWFGAEIGRDEKASKAVNENFKAEDEKSCKAAYRAWSELLRG